MTNIKTLAAMISLAGICSLALAEPPNSEARESD